MPTQTADDERFMREAITEGEKGLGLTSPNPPVGAIIIQDGEIIGRGHHRKAGGPHAEVNAIVDAADTEGTTIYVTLEPCSTHGQTPPCVEAIKNAGIKRVVVGATDPNPEHVGAGFQQLRDAGIEVTSGVLEEEANHLIRFFTKRITTGLPWVIAKTATTLDGRTSLNSSESQWISSEESREDVQNWRQQCDAILIGGETFRRDNPSLTLRGRYAEEGRQPLRVVLTSSEDIPSEHHLFTDEHAALTRIHQGFTFQESLETLANEGVSAVLLESGGRLLAHALKLGFVDEIVLYLAPRLGGGDTSLIPSPDLGVHLENMQVDLIGPDIRIVSRVKSSEQSHQSLG